MTGSGRLASTPLLARLAPELHALLLPGGPEVIHLGAADAEAETLILDALREARRRPRVVAGDGSADVERLKAPPGGSPRLVLLLGDALRGAAPEALASDLRRLLRRGDHVLIDATLERDRLHRLLADVAALDVVREIESEDGQVRLVLARPSA